MKNMNKKCIVIAFAFSIITSNIYAAETNIDYEQQFRQLVDRSDKFDQKYCKFPPLQNRIAILGNTAEKRQKICDHFANTYHLVHEKTYSLLCGVLALKKEKGTRREQAIYGKKNLGGFIKRLFTNRPLVCVESYDKEYLRSTEHREQIKKNTNIPAYGSAELFIKVGTPDEISPVTLEKYLSYDEIALAALLGISSQTYFINSGRRDNCGEIYHAGEAHEEDGVLCGLVGARFEKLHYMEWPHMVITPEQNTPGNGYGLTASNCGLLGLWSNFYGEKFPTFAEAQADQEKYLPIPGKGHYFNVSVYKKRMHCVIEPFLRDAQKRAFDQKKSAYVHIVGLGLSDVWRIHPQQKEFMLEVYKTILDEIDFPNISNINFSWIGTGPAFNDITKGKPLTQKNSHITIEFSRRNPSARLEGQEDAGKLIIAMYAWDGNAYPGNEYWIRSLDKTGDPAAMCSSTGAEVQNPKINPFIKENIDKMTPTEEQVANRFPDETAANRQVIDRSKSADEIVKPVEIVVEPVESDDEKEPATEDPKAATNPNGLESEKPELTNADPSKIDGNAAKPGDKKDRDDVFKSDSDTDPESDSDTDPESDSDTDPESDSDTDPAEERKQLEKQQLEKQQLEKQSKPVDIKHSRFHGVNLVPTGGENQGRNTRFLDQAGDGLTRDIDSSLNQDNAVPTPDQINPDPKPQTPEKKSADDTTHPGDSNPHAGSEIPDADKTTIPVAPQPSSMKSYINIKPIMATLLSAGAVMFMLHQFNILPAQISQSISGFSDKFMEYLYKLIPSTAKKIA